MAYMRRYVRRVIPWMRFLDDWHEMLGPMQSTLCDEALKPTDDHKFQHLSGTDFPLGNVCQKCRSIRDYLDTDGIGVLTDDGIQPKGWPQG